MKEKLTKETDAFKDFDIYVSQRVTGLAIDYVLVDLDLADFKTI